MGFGSTPRCSLQARGLLERCAKSKPELYAWLRAKYNMGISEVRECSERVQ